MRRGGMTAKVSERVLASVRSVLDGHVARGYASGMAALIGRDEEAQVLAAGAKALGLAEPMRRDTIFRIASMTKPVTAAAAMMLIEDGKVRLDEPVDRLLPELAGRRVLKRIDAPLEDTVPAKRPVTV